jgi:hypothetical protein
LQALEHLVAAANVRLGDLVLKDGTPSLALAPLDRAGGNTLSLEETRTILHEGIAIGGKLLREHFEVMNGTSLYDINIHQTRICAHTDTET